jgi:hypothetical protein
MPLSITCACGARLEFDDRFAGQAIPCPDCQAPLHLPTPEPQRQLRVSGLAVISLTVALVGAFTLVGALAGVVLGILARRRIEREPQRWSGLVYARAAILVGSAGTALTLLTMCLPEFLHQGALLREFKWARRLDYTFSGAKDPQLKKAISGGGFDLTCTIPSPQWGVWQPSISEGEYSTDLVILVNAWNDAQIACQSVSSMDPDDLKDWDTTRAKGLERFARSELVHLLSRNSKAAKEPKPRDVKTLDDTTQEMFVDLRLGGVDRTFTLRMCKKAGSRLLILVGGTRSYRFAGMQDEFRKTFDSFRLKDD